MLHTQWHLFQLQVVSLIKTFVCLVCLEDEKAKKDPKYYLNRANKDTLGILSELEKTYKEPVSLTDTNL